MSAQKLFITGGSGYVGRNLIRHFVARNWPVVALARSAAAADIVAGLGAEPVDGELFSSDLAERMAGCTMLVHAAADTNHGYGGAEQVRINVGGTCKVLEAAEAAGVTRAVCLSTESVLLDGRPLVNANETHPYPKRPAGSYSRSKGGAERLALSMNAPGFAVIAIRPRFVWGRDDTTALPHLVAALRSGQFAWIEGGRYLTSTTHIANLCAGVDLALSRGRGGQAYFITDGAPVMFRTLVTDLLKTQGLSVPDKTVPRALLRVMALAGEGLATMSSGRVRLPITLQEFATSAVEVSLDITKAQNELGYAPVMTMSAGLAEMRAGGV